MKILLINDNPVVSRLLVLCTREESVVLDEAVSADTVKSDDYDIVLVDEASYGADVAELLTLLGRCKKVYISYDNEAMKGFNTTIKKPFLPSQILELIENLGSEEEVIEQEVETIEEDHFIFPLATEESLEENTPEEKSEEGIEESEMPTIFPLSENDDTLEEIQEDGIFEIGEEENPAVLDSNEIDKIKALLDMEEEELELPTEDLSDDEYETRKIEVIKEQLIADGLEIVGEEEIVEVLSSKSEKKKEKKKKNKSKKKKTSKKTGSKNFEDKKLEDKKSKKKKSDSKKSDNKKSESKKSKKKEIAFTEEELESIEDAIEVAVGTMTKKQMKQLLKGKKIDVSIEIEGDK